MPLSVVKTLSLGEITRTNMTLQMADRTMTQPKGVLEDVLIKVGKFIFLVDFVIRFQVGYLKSTKLIPISSYCCNMVTAV